MTLAGSTSRTTSPFSSAFHESRGPFSRTERRRRWKDAPGRSYDWRTRWSVLRANPRHSGPIQPAGDNWHDQELILGVNDVHCAVGVRVSGKNGPGGWDPEWSRSGRETKASNRSGGVFVEQRPLVQFKSHIEGKNADVVIYPDRVEWAREGLLGTGGKLALGAMTGGLSFLKTGVRGSQQGSEVIPVRSMTSVTTQRDGLRFTNVRVICSGNTIDFRLGHDEAKRIKELLASLMLGNHPSQASSAAPPPPPPSGSAPGPPDVMEQIARLGQLRDAGLLTDDEFAAKKADLLGRL